MNKIKNFTTLIDSYKIRKYYFKKISNQKQNKNLLIIFISLILTVSTVYTILKIFV